MLIDKSITLFVAMLLSGSMAFGQSADAVVMTVNGQPVRATTWQRYCQKQRQQAQLEQPSLKTLRQRFIDFQLILAAAREARLDTLSTIQQPMASINELPCVGTQLADASIETEALQLYQRRKQRVDAAGGMTLVQALLVKLPQQASKREEQQAKLLADSIARALKQGADATMFLAHYADDIDATEHQEQGVWLYPGETLPEFETQMQQQPLGTWGDVFVSPAGYHILKVIARQPYFAYEEVRDGLLKFISQRRLRRQLRAMQQESKPTSGKDSTACVAASKLIPAATLQDFRDELMVLAVLQREVWQKHPGTTAEWERFFAQNKKRYRWTSPRFQGVVCYAATAKDLAQAKKSIRKQPVTEWKQCIEAALNTDSTKRVQVIDGWFMQDENAAVDYAIFKRGNDDKAPASYPFVGVWGKKFKAPPSFLDALMWVKADYQEQQQKAWLAQLRQKYVVEVNDALLEETIKERNNKK